MPISTPSQITVPFATSGLKNAIPPTSNPVTGNAGYDAGFPATNMMPKEAGGIPPFGQDFNGILFDITTAIQYLEAGMQFPYSSSFATAVGGYPLGAIVTRTDGTGFWRNTVANNTTNPETFGAGWQPEGAGISTVSMSNANVTLTALQAAQPIILITGTLTANLNLILPAYTKQWAVVNSATGASFGVTVKTADGSGYQVMTGASATVFGDGTNIRGIVLVTPQATESVSGVAKVATQALTNAGVDDSTIVTPKKLGVKVTDAIATTLGYNQTWRDLTASRATGTNYTNGTGKAIAVSVFTGNSGVQGLYLNVDGVSIAQSYAGTGVQVWVGGIVPPGSSYSITLVGTPVSKWLELRT